MPIESTFSFQDEDIDFELNSETEIKEWLNSVAIEEKATIGLIEYIFCSDEFLLEMNKTHLKHDYLTDIITFSLNSSPIEANVFISVERIKENAQLYDQSFKDELHRVIVHGLLHLLKYNDKSDEEKAIMRSKEDEYLGKRTFI